MSAQTQKVDVLAVMDSCIANVMHEYSMPPANPEQVAEMIIKARSAVSDLIVKAKRAERLLRDMAEAGFGNPEQADELRAALARVGGAA